MSNRPYAIREYRDDDEAFIYNSWLKSFRGAHFSGVLPSDLYYEAYRTLIDRILFDDRTSIAVCHNIENENQIFGYAVAADLGEHQPVLHYIYVKDPFRRAGIMKELVRHLQIERLERFFYTFRTGICKKLTGPTGVFPMASFKPSLGSKYNHGSDSRGSLFGGSKVSKTEKL